MVSEIEFDGKCIVLADHRFAAILGLLLTSLADYQDITAPERSRWTKLWTEELANPVHGMRDLKLAEVVRGAAESQSLIHFLEFVKHEVDLLGAHISAGTLNRIAPCTIHFGCAIPSCEIREDLDSIIGLLRSGRQFP